MNIEECYDTIGGNYQEVKQHIPKEALIQRFVIKFLSDESYEKIKEALQNENYEEAFYAAHTLKGVCMNLCFKRLGNSVSELTELLRKHDKKPIDKNLCMSLWEQLSRDYAEVTDAVSKLE